LQKLSVNSLHLEQTINETSKNYIFSRLIQVTELYKIWDRRRDKYRELNNSTVLTSVVELDPDTDTDPDPDPVSDPGFDEQKLEKCG
jgi:hypothetical protein